MIEADLESQPDWYRRLTAKLARLAQQAWPYVYGGGHNPAFSPSIGLTKGQTIGYDCSGVVGAAFHDAFGADFPRPLGTHELEQWGLPGKGELMILWTANRVIDGRIVEHCVIERPHAPPEHRFFMAHFTGGPPCGFLAQFDTTGYTPRRRRP